MEQQEIIAFLAGLPLFSGVPQELIADLPGQAGFSLEAYPAGSYVMRQGDPARRLGFLYAGDAEVQKAAGESRMLVNILRTGDITGATTLFLPDAAAANTLYTRHGCTMLYLTEMLFRSLMERSFVLAEHYICYLTGRIRFLDGRVRSIASPTAADKLYNHILQNAAEGGFRPQSSMTALATTLSLSRASLYRALEELEQAGLIRRKNKTIEIL